ncbi:MAG: hypothetical protein CBC13_10730 [Planctomycetia bacterium TMED53]|nr:MAG: hypothetical protein CBC13_10730 [Planctomycetia bacterium TMED53]
MTTPALRCSGFRIRIGKNVRDSLHHRKNLATGDTAESSGILGQGGSLRADAGQLLQQVRMDAIVVITRHVSTLPVGGYGKDLVRWGLAFTAEGNYISLILRERFQRATESACSC